MNTPNNLRYTKEHEWIRMDGNTAIMGITDFAQDQLGDVVYVELPEIGKDFKKGEALGVVESVKTVSDIFSPVQGKVSEVNQSLNECPELINKDPYDKGWILKMEVVSPDIINDLLDQKAYEKLIKEA